MSGPEACAALAREEMSGSDMEASIPEDLESILTSLKLSLFAPPCGCDWIGELFPMMGSIKQSTAKIVPEVTFLQPLNLTTGQSGK